MEEINYRAFQEADRKYGGSNLSSMRSLRNKALYLSIATAFAINAIWSIFSDRNLLTWSWLYLLAVPALAMLFVTVYSAIKYSTQRNKLINASPETIKRFANANGYSYEAEIKSGIEGLHGSLLSKWLSTEGKNVVKGSLHGSRFSLFEYEYEVGTSDNKHKVKNIVGVIILKRDMPHFIIDSLVEGNGLRPSVLPVQFDRSQRLELEGDFNRYFDLYIPDKYQVAALTILAPDIMQLLLELGAKCDVEVIGSQLYFYWPKDDFDISQFARAHRTMNVVYSKINDQLNDLDIFGTPEQKLHHQEIRSEPAVKLKKSGKKVAGGSVAVMVAITVFPFLLALLVPAALIFILLALRGSKKTQARALELEERYGGRTKFN